MKWNLDTAHSEILFTIRHMMISKVRGQFEKFSANVNLDWITPKTPPFCQRQLDLPMATIRNAHAD